MEILGEDIAMLRTHSRNGWTVSESGSAQKQEKPFGVNMAKRLANTFVPLVHSLISCSKCSSKTVLFIKMMGPFYGSPDHKNATTRTMTVQFSISKIPERCQLRWVEVQCLYRKKRKMSWWEQIYGYWLGGLPRPRFTVGKSSIHFVWREPPYY